MTFIDPVPVAADPQAFIRNWARFSRGLESHAPKFMDDPAQAERDAVVNTTYTDARGRVYFGLPLDPRRAIPGYLMSGDPVYVWGHAWNFLQDAGMKMSTEDPEEDWLDFLLENRRGWDDENEDVYNTGGNYRINWADEMNAAVEAVICDISANAREVTLVGDEEWYYSSTCLALPVDLHEARIRCIAGWTESWSDVQALRELGCSIPFSAT